MRTGRKPIRYAVHTELLTVRQVAERVGVTVGSIYGYRQRHTNPDGTPLSLEETYDAYMRARRKGRKHVAPRQSKARRYRIGRREVTADEAAAELGVTPCAIRNRLFRCKGDMEEVYRQVEAQKKRRAARAIMDILNERCDTDAEQREEE